MEEQERYLKETPFKYVIARGAKKLLTEMTSVKFLLLVFIGIGIWQRFISDSIGLGAALVVVGLREIDFDGLVRKVKV